MKILRVTTGMILLAGALAAATGDMRLVDAARNKDAKAVRELLAQRAPVNMAAPDGFTALHEAVRYDNLEIADLLIAAGADVTAATRYNITPLSLACANGNAAMIERLLKPGADPNSTSEDGQTALMTAALAGKVDAVKMLLAHGAKVNVQEPTKGQTALMWAASEGNTAAAEIVDRVRRRLKVKSKTGFTPLLFAVRNGHKDTVQALLAHGANVQRCCFRRHQRPQYGGGQRLFRSCRRSAGSRRGPQCSRCPRIGAAYAGVAAQAGLGWRQWPGTQILRSSASHWEHDCAGAREGSARSRGQSQCPNLPGRKRSSKRKAAPCGIRRSSSSAGIT